MKSGDLLSALGGDAEVLSILFDQQRVPVYNLSIPNSPTYYVGEHGVWVHNCSNYRKLFISAFEKDERTFPAGYHVHHRIPQKYRDIFPNGEVDQLDNWVGVPVPIHKKINAEWVSFGKGRRNPGPDEVREFVS